MNSCRPKGGIEPLRRQSATGLKPAPQTTEVHPGTHDLFQSVYIPYSSH